MKCEDGEENWPKDRSFSEKSSQTDEELIYNYAWQKYYHHFQQSKIESPQVDTVKQREDLKTEIKPQTETSNHFKYNEKFYYDPQTALYYDKDNQLYLDIDTGIYYNYVQIKETGGYHIRYHSKIKRKQWELMNNQDADIIWLDEQMPEEDLKLKEKETIEKNIKNKLKSLEINLIPKKNFEEGEIEENSDDETEISVSKLPPCIRAILIQISSVKDPVKPSANKLGTLFIIPYTGGTIGKNSNSNLIDLSNELDVDNSHASILYDTKKRQYFVKDLSSKNGTFVNGIQVEIDKQAELNHGDKLNIGKSVTLLIHIHQGSTTCINCEPGEVMHKFKLEEEQTKKTQFIQDPEASRRQMNKIIKKKYGLKWENSDMSIESEDQGKYVNRAKIRRDKVGVDVSHIEVKAAASSIDVPISSENKGLKLLKSMGWKEGHGLGKLENGITEPINSKIRLSTSGLGYENSELGLDANEEQKKKMISWNKTKARFSLVDKQSQKKMVDIFKEDEDED